MTHEPTLRELRAEFARSRFLAMPIAGTIAWTVAGILGAVLPAGAAALAMFICVGMTFGLGALIGEPLLGKERRDNPLDRLFLLTVLMANLVWAIAIPFFMGAVLAPADPGHPGGADVGALLVDRPALGRPVTRGRAYALSRRGVVSVPGASLRGHPGGDRGHLPDLDRRARDEVPATGRHS